MLRNENYFINSRSSNFKIFFLGMEFWNPSNGQEKDVIGGRGGGGEGDCIINERVSRAPSRF